MHHGQLLDLATEVVKLLGTLTPIPPLDDEGLRQRYLELLAEFKARAVRAGYHVELVDAARFALVALIDERVMALDAPIREAWEAAPLQRHLFQTFNAREAFFDRLATVRTPADGEHADVLELFHLCLCLGFKGRMVDPAHLEARTLLIAQIAAEVRAVRSGAQAVTAASSEAVSNAAAPHPGRWYGLPLWTVPLALGVVVAVWWFATALWSSTAIQHFVRDFPVR